MTNKKVMHAHPGEVLREEYIRPKGLNVTTAARLLGVTRQALNNIVNGKSGISPEMALLIASNLGGTPEMWQRLQRDYDLQNARKARARGAREASASTWVDSSDLVNWTATNDGHYYFPHVIRRLVRANARKVQYADFPIGDDVQKPGWDGLALSSAGATNVPVGWSGWEIGTESKPGPKAESDYLKRKASPGDRSPRDITYVAVTSKRWNGKRNWASEKAREGFWKTVIAYDATDIEQWLEIERGVMVWLAARIGRRPPGVQSLEEFWGEFHRSTSPPITPELVLAGRSVAEKCLSDWLQSGSGTFRILGDSSDEVLAFVAAIVLTLPDLLKGKSETVSDSGSIPPDYLQDQLLARTILVSEPEQARLLIDSPDKFMLAWCGEDTTLVGSAVAEGHRVLVPLSRDAAATKAPDLELPRLGRQAFAQALISGLPGNDEERTQRANQIVRRTGRSLTVYRRLYSAAGVSSTPEWARRENARDLIPALLAGSWTERNEADKAILARLAGCDYAAFSRKLAQWSSAGSPLRTVDKTWLFSAPMEAWSLLAKFVSNPDVDLFKEIVLEVLREDDPALDLPLDERWLANIHGKEFRHSAVLRNGLADSLILVSVVGEAAGIPNASEGIVRDLLGQESKVRWASLSGLLRKLAEAAPDAFLRVIEDSLEDNPACVLYLFEEDKGPLGGGCRHAELLWALEVLSWYPEFFPRATRVLATLARLDPGGSYANRPKRSLYDIFCAWRSSSSAPLETRLEVLDNLLAMEPDVGWELLLDLLPTGHMTANPTAEPRWREKPERSVGTPLETYRTYEHVISHALACSRANADRLVRLLSKINYWSPNQRAQFFAEVRRFAESCAEAEKRSLCNQMRESLALHRRHAEANWALPETELSVMEELWRLLEPQDLVERHRWLFDNDFVYLPSDPVVWRRDDAHRVIRQTEEEASLARCAAAGAILLERGIDGILSLAVCVQQPLIIGRTLADIVTEAEPERIILERTLTGDNNVRDVGRGFVSRRFAVRGESWVHSILESTVFRAWEVEKRAEFCLGLPSRLATWDIVRQLGEAVQTLYWRQAVFFLGREVTEQEAEFAAGRLLQADRPFDALEKAGWHPDKLSSVTLMRILDATKDKLIADKNLPRPSCFQQIDEVFARLQSDPEIEVDELARLEWIFIPWLRNGSGPTTLHRRLQREAEFFAQAIQVVYRPEDNEERSNVAAEVSDEETQTRAELAWRMLEDWTDWPGRREDGTLDAESLRMWFRAARAACAATGHAKIGDDRIGRVLAYTPSDSDGVWPDIAVRELIEEAKSKSLDEGTSVGRYNMRGVTARSPFAGGFPERKLAAQYRDWSRKLKYRWIRTSRLLDDIAHMYESDGRREDDRAEYRDLVD